jgi:WD40 repeat protein
MNSRTILIILINILLLSCALHYSYADNVNPPEDLTGDIFFNVRGNDKFYEYHLNLSTNTFTKTEELRNVYIHKVDYFEVIDKSDDFIAAEERLKNKPHQLEVLTDKFNRDELIAISQLFSRSISGECKPNAIYPIKQLEDKNSIIEAENKLDQRLVLTDNQRKYGSLSLPYMVKGSGAIIDIHNKQVIFPFCGNIVRDIVWSPNGRYIAYSIGDVNEFSGRILVLYGVDEKRVILKRDAGEYISSMTWDPTSKYVALLSKKTRYFSLKPSDILGLISGHPTEYGKFSLRIFNFQDEVKLIEHFVTKVKNGDSDILWDDKI